MPSNLPNQEAPVTELADMPQAAVPKAVADDNDELKEFLARKEIEKRAPSKDSIRSRADGRVARNPWLDDEYDSVI